MINQTRRKAKNKLPQAELKLSWNLMYRLELNVRAGIKCMGCN
jgi:hypothetical protein